MKVRSRARHACFGLLISSLCPGLAVAADAPPQACNLKRVASLDAVIEGGSLLIPVKLDDRQTYLRLDSGSPVSMVTQALADELKLPSGSIRSGAVIDASGHAFGKFVTLHTLQLDQLTAHNVQFVVGGPSNSRARRIDGTLGADFMAKYDVEFDLAHGKVNWFLQDHCKGQVVYWSQDFTSIPFKMDASLHIVVPVTLEGKELRAIVDTGATASVFNAKAARQIFDIDPAANNAKPDGEMFAGTGNSLPFYRHRFLKFEIGGVEFHNTEFVLIPDKTSNLLRSNSDKAAMSQPRMDSEQNMSAQIMIGLHHLAKLRVYAAYGERTLYVTAADAH